MGWAPGNARWHTIRLIREQWIDRVALPRGDGSLLFATPKGVRVAAVDVATTPRPPRRGGRTTPGARGRRRG
jgi:hypothetical protein